MRLDETNGGTIGASFPWTWTQRDGTPKMLAALHGVQEQSQVVKTESNN